MPPSNDPRDGFAYRTGDASAETLRRLAAIKDRKEECPITSTEALSAIRREAQVTALWESATRLSGTKESHFNRSFVHAAVTSLPEFVGTYIEGIMSMALLDEGVFTQFDISATVEGEYLWLTCSCFDYAAKRNKVLVTSKCTKAMHEVLAEMISEIAANVDPDTYDQTDPNIDLFETRMENTVFASLVLTLDRLAFERHDVKLVSLNPRKHQGLGKHWPSLRSLKRLKVSQTVNQNDRWN